MQREDNDLSPIAQTALWKMRALRGLPKTSSTDAAERRVIKGLNVTDTLRVALALALDEEEAANDN
jgi:hypothetical protein